MVSTVTGHADTTKRSLDTSNVDQSVIEDKATRVDLGLDVVALRGLVSEDVHGKRGVVVLVHVLDTLLDGSGSENGQKRAENLVLHQGIIVGDLCDDSRSDESSLLVSVTSSNDLSLGLAQHGGKSVPVVGGGDLGKVGVVLVNLTTVELVNPVLAGVDKLLLHLGLDNHVVGSHTGLASVYHLTPQGSLSGKLDVLAVLGDKNGRLTSELEDDGCQVLVGGSGNDLTDSVVTSVHNLVELLLEGLGDDGDTSLDGLEDVGVEGLGAQVANNFGSVGGHFGELDSHSVTGSQSSNERRHGQHKGVVPGRDDEHVSKRSLSDLGGGDGVLQVGLDVLVGGPLLEVGNHVVKLAPQETHLAQVSLVLGSAEILVHGVLDGLDIVSEDVVQVSNLVQSVVEIEGLSGSEALSQSLDVARNLVERSGRHNGFPIKGRHFYWWCV